MSKKPDSSHYAAFATAVVFAAVILFVFGYRTFTSKDRQAAERVPVGESAASERAAHGWHASMGTGHPSPNGSERVGLEDGAAGRAGRPVAGKPTPVRASGLRTPTPRASAASRTASVHGSGVNEPASPPSGESGDLSISGRVLNQEKEAVSGIEVTARRYSFQRNAGEIAGSAVSAEDGRYEIGGLAEGEYDIRTIATDLYREGQLAARAGVSSADIVIEGYGYEIHIAGTVTDPDGRPLAAVHVIPPDLRRQTLTDSSGNYATSLVIKGTEGTYYAVRFDAKGYREKLVRVDGSSAAGTEERRVDAQLEPVGETVLVPGAVNGEDGSPVVGARVQLQSGQQASSYGAITGADGKFSIAAVKVGADYRLTVFPGKRYRDYEEAPVAVSDGMFLDIVLQGLDTGRLTGRMVDAEGRTIPRFSLWLSSSDARTQVTQVSGDEHGAFAVDQAPAGALTCSTRSVPQFTVNGITVEAGQTQDVTLVLDWGDHVLGGRVTDSRGQPVAGASVALSWSNQAAGLMSSSSRTASTDTAGSFRFTQLGPGPHMLTVQALGVQDVREVEGSRDVEVRLP